MTRSSATARHHDAHPRCRFVRLAGAAALLAALAGCSGGGDSGAAPPPPLPPSLPPPPAPPGPAPSPSVLAPIAVPGATYWVDASAGHDDNDGLSAARPMRSLAAAADRLSPLGGDRLLLSGTFAESLILRNINDPATGAPEPALPTVIQCAFDVGGAPIAARIDGGLSSAASFPFDKQGLPAGFGPGTGNYLDLGIEITDCNHVTVSGIEVRGIAGHGIRAFGSSHLRLEHLRLEWVAWSAILLNNGGPTEPMTSGVTVTRCRINQSNLGSWENLATGQGYNMRPETVSIVMCDGFSVVANHLSNSLMEGIDFKMGSRNGTISNNIVENTRSAGIYCNEGRDALIFHNIVRAIGFYDPEDGSGLQLAAPWISARIPPVVTASGASGIVIGNGDLAGIGETGRASGLRVFENAISWTLKCGVSINNQWRVEGRTGWLLDDILVYNNVAYRNNQGSSSGFAAIAIDVGVTNSAFVNNIVCHSGRRGIGVWQAQLGAFFATSGISHNLDHLNGEPVITGINARRGDPRFVLEPLTPGAPADFRLLPGSPAIDTGMRIQLPLPVTTPTDIGAYQLEVPAWTAGVDAVP